MRRGNKGYQEQAKKRNGKGEKINRKKKRNRNVIKRTNWTDRTKTGRERSEAVMAKKKNRKGEEEPGMWNRDRNTGKGKRKKENSKLQEKGNGRRKKRARENEFIIAESDDCVTFHLASEKSIPINTSNCSNLTVFATEILAPSTKNVNGFTGSTLTTGFVNFNCPLALSKLIIMTIISRTMLLT